MKKGMYIQGEWVTEAEKTFDVKNPATEEIVATLPYGGEKETTRAIDAASEAFIDWQETTAYERAELLKEWHTLLIEDKENLAQLMTREMGKPIKESRGEVVYGADYVEWYAEEAKRLYGTTIPAKSRNKRMIARKKPVGVVAAITPWNFPMAMLTRKIAPALAAGCTVVMKPASASPLTAMRLVELAEEAGFPKGVINLVVGSSKEIGDTIMKDERVRKVTFTGSTAVGKELIRQSADNVKKVSMELGGHAPFIVCEDADIEKAVEGVMASKFRNAGQTCVCANRIYVQKNIYTKFAERLAEKTSELTVGDGLDESCDIGPLINESGLEKVTEHVKDARSKGAKVLTGGKRLERKGTFYEPTILADITEDMLIMHEETFGPIAPLQSFDTKEEAVALANSTPFGLAAYIFTESMATGTYLIDHLDFGIVGWNDGGPSAAQAPFGGVKESGLGREGGHEGIESYLDTQYISIGHL